MIPSTKFIAMIIGSLCVTGIQIYAMSKGHFEFTNVCLGLIGGNFMQYNGLKTLQNHLLNNGNGKETTEVKKDGE